MGKVPGRLASARQVPKRKQIKEGRLGSARHENEKQKSGRSAPMRALFALASAG
jgi:hypothetical protein